MNSKDNFDSKSRHFVPINYLPQDTGVLVQDVLSLVSNCDFAGQLVELLEIDKIKNDFIGIAGASMLIDCIKTTEKRFLKIDVTSNYLDLKFNDNPADKSINLVFSNLTNTTFANGNRADNEHLLEEGILTAVPVRDAKSDFFSELHNLGTYANDLLKNGYGKLVLTNLDLLREIYSEKETLIKKYRLLKDRHDNYWVRGIVSDTYVDYNNGVAVFIGLISLYKNMLETGDSYAISLCEYNESSIRVFFEKKGQRKVGDLCRVKHLIELSNNELGKGTFELSGVASIEYNSGSEIREVYFAPGEVEFSFANIYHRYKPKTVVEKLKLSANITKVENALYEDIAFIGEIKEPDHIRFLLQQKVNADTNIKPFITGEIVGELDQEIKTVHQLLDIMHRLDIVVSDIDKKEYLRYLLYNMIKTEKKRREAEKTKKGKRI